jgi:7-cyano-7-deazaguanine synthase in queuosine biosynthesis
VSNRRKLDLVKLAKVMARNVAQETRTTTRKAYRPDGTWSCVRDHVTEPCGQCGPCKTILASYERETAQ